MRMASIKLFSFDVSPTTSDIPKEIPNGNITKERIWFPQSANRNCQGRVATASHRPCQQVITPVKSPP